MNKKNSTRKDDFRRLIDRTLAGDFKSQSLIFVSIFILSWILLGVLYYIVNSLTDDRFTFGIGMVQSLADILSPDKFGEYAHEKPFTTNRIIRIVTAIGCFIGAFVFQGVLVATVFNAIQSRIDRVREGEVNYQFVNHYLILGYDDYVPFLIKGIQRKDANALVVVMVQKEVIKCRELIENDQKNKILKRLQFCTATGRKLKILKNVAQKMHVAYISWAKQMRPIEMLGT